MKSLSQLAAAIAGALAALLVAVPVIALGAVVISYDGSSPLNPGGFWSTTSPSHADRNYNQACREDNSGQMSVKYFNTGGVLVDQSGTSWTNCLQLAYVSIGSGSNVRARCTNEGTVQFYVNCKTTNP